MLSSPGRTVVRFEKRADGEDDATDLALVYLAPLAAADATWWTELLERKMTAPWPSSPLLPVVFGFPPRPDSEASGFNGESPERRRGPTSELLRFGGYWQGEAPDLVGGNSGGPLYTVEATGRRLFGVAVRGGWPRGHHERLVRHYRARQRLVAEAEREGDAAHAYLAHPARFRSGHALRRGRLYRCLRYGPRPGL